MSFFSKIGNALKTVFEGKTITVTNPNPVIPAAPKPASQLPQTGAFSVSAVGTKGKNSLTPQQIASGIAYNETRGIKGDPYAFSKPSGQKNLGNAIGKYQVTEGELKDNALKYLGRTVTAKEFQSSPNLQEQYIINKITALKKAGVSDADIIGQHRAGKYSGGASAAPDYVKSALESIASKSVETPSIGVDTQGASAQFSPETASKSSSGNVFQKIAQVAGKLPIVSDVIRTASDAQQNGLFPTLVSNVKATANRFALKSTDTPQQVAQKAFESGTSFGLTEPGAVEPLRKQLLNLGEDAINKIAKTSTVEDIVSFLKKKLVGVAEKDITPIAEKLAPISNPDEIKQALDGLTKERGFINTVKESPNTAPEVAQQVEGRYTPITNKATLEEAQKLVDSNLDEAVKLVHSNEPATAHSNAVGQLLIKKFQTEGNYQAAIDVVEKLAQKATTQGQAIQALSMYNRLTPEGVLRYAQRVIGKELKPQVAEDIVKQAEKAKAFPEGSKENIVETAKVLQKIADNAPVTARDKVVGFLNIAQLLNPKTFIRNIGGNAGFGILENLKDIVATPFDTALSLITKERTKTLPSFEAQFKGLKSGFSQGVQDALQRIDTTGGVQVTQFELPRTPAFKGAVGKKLQQFLDLELKAPDRAFYQAAYDGSLYQQMKAAGVSVPTDAMKEVAHYDALYRTFQDENVISNFFQKMKRAFNTLKLGPLELGEIVLRYPKTPANILARGIEYSPAGFINTVFEAAKPLFGEAKFNQKAVVESFSRALTGSSLLVGTGALLHHLGLITGKPDSDIDVRGTQRLVGLGKYQLNLSGLKRFILSGLDVQEAQLQKGDKLMSYDWFQPTAIGVSIGANIDEGQGTTQGGVIGFLKKFKDNLGENIAAGTDTLAEQPLISGLKRLLQQQTLSGSALEIIKNIPSSFIPTFLSQINQLLDNKQRDSYDPSTIKYGLNLAKAKIPGLAQTLPEQVGVNGNTLERYQDGSNNVFNVFFNPSFTSKYKPTPDAQMVLDIMNETGDKAQFPRTVQRTQTINGVKTKLNARQINALQRYVGTVTKQLFTSFATDPQFSALPTDEKVKYLQNILTDVGAAGKIIVLGDRPKKISARVQRLLELASSPTQ